MQADYVPFVNGVMIPDYEGGYCWDAGDAGGPTKYGITCYDLAEHRGQKMNSMAAWAPIVKAMTLDEADAIYQTKYANSIGFDTLPAGPDCCEMDYGVNSGLGRVKRVRAALLAKANKPTVEACDPKWYVDAMCQERQVFLNGLGQRMPQFLHGWTERVIHLREYCEHLANNTATVKVPVSPAVKAAPVAVHPSPGPVTAPVIAHGGGVVAAHAAGIPWEPIVAVSGIGLIAVLVWNAYRQAQSVQANTTVVLPATIPPHP